MQPRWKLIGVAGLTGVAATGVIVARKRRSQREYDPDELRERLHSRLAGASTGTVNGAARGSDASGTADNVAP
jgi:hypothetical protein